MSSVLGHGQVRWTWLDCMRIQLMLNNGSQRLTIISGNSASRHCKPVATEVCTRQTTKRMLVGK
jgi:hypothetical protein